MRVLNPVGEVVTDTVDVFVGAVVRVFVILKRGDPDVRGDAVTEVVCVDVLDARVEYDCVAEPVDVFEIEDDPVAVRVRTGVVDMRADTDQHAEDEMLGEIVLVLVEEPVAVAAPLRVAAPLGPVDRVCELLVVGVREPLRVGREVPVPELETVAVFRATTVVVPLEDIVGVFDKGAFRLPVVELLDVREPGIERVRVALTVGDLDLGADRVVVLEGRGVILALGVNVLVREPLMLNVAEDDTVDVLDGPSVAVSVRLIGAVLLCIAETESDELPVEVFDARRVADPVGDTEEVFEGGEERV